MKFKQNTFINNNRKPLTYQSITDQTASVPCPGAQWSSCGATRSSSQNTPRAQIPGETTWTWRWNVSISCTQAPSAIQFCGTVYPWCSGRIRFESSWIDTVEKSTHAPPENYRSIGDLSIAFWYKIRLY